MIILWTGMDEPWKKVLLEHRDAILKSADPHDVFLDHLIHHLHSKGCIECGDKQLVKNERLSLPRVANCWTSCLQKAAGHSMSCVMRSKNLVLKIRNSWQIYYGVHSGRRIWSRVRCDTFDNSHEFRWRICESGRYMRMSEISQL